MGNLVLQPMLRAGEKPGNTLYDFCGITPDAHFMRAIGASPFPNLVEHFAVKRADVGLLQRVGRCHGSAVERPRLGLQNVQCFVFVQLSHRADSRNQLLRFLSANGRVPVCQFLIEDEVHRVLFRFSRR